MVQLGGVIRDMLNFSKILLNLAKNRTDITRDLGKDFLDKRIDRFNKELQRLRVRIIGCWTTLLFSHEEIDDIIKVVKCLEDAGFLIKGVNEMFGNEVKE